MCDLYEAVLRSGLSYLNPRSAHGVAIPESLRGSLISKASPLHVEAY